MSTSKLGVKGFCLLLMVFFCSCFALSVEAKPGHSVLINRCMPYKLTLKREAEALYGIAAPVPMFAGQLLQESSCKASITAADGGQGIAQFMPATAKQIAKQYPTIGPASPYNPTWAIRAQLRLNYGNHKIAKGITDCDKWGGTLKGYNAGMGFVTRAYKKSPEPEHWWNVTEDINTGQSATNFKFSRESPRKILFKHQALFSDWGPVMCDLSNPPLDY